MNKVYTFDANSMRKIADTVRIVNGQKPVQSGGWYPYRPPKQEIVIGKTAAAWAKGARATIAVYAGDPLVATGAMFEARNLFADVEAGKWVAVLGGFLISAEC